MFGFGAGAWGGVAWGAGSFGSSGPFTLSGVTAVADNRVRLFFTQPPAFTELLDVGDGSDPRNYMVQVLPVTDGSGVLGRSVTVSRVQQVVGQPLQLDVVLDRPMSTYPASYQITVTGVAPTGGGSVMDAGAFSFSAVGRSIEAPVPDVVIPSRDIANPQTLSAALDSGIVVANPTLGIYQADGTGDYATDSGLDSLKKRIFRRLTTRKGAFVHQPEYGVGTRERVKRLATLAVRETLAHEAEQQILLEPEVVQCRVTLEEQDAGSGVFRFVVLVRTRTGLNVKHVVPVAGSVDLRSI